MDNKPDRALVALCEALVIRALEQVGKRVLRESRARYKLLRGPVTTAHTQWQPSVDRLDHALRIAWEPLPGLVAEHATPGTDPAQVRAALDRYVRDLIAERRVHTVTELRTRLGAFTP